MKNKKANGLVPNTRYNEFILGANISDYLHKRHSETLHEEATFTNISYYFYREKVSVWANLDGCITAIRCASQCMYKDTELINMDFDKFLSLVQAAPDSEDIVYLMVNNRGQNQHVYEFERLGLQIWTWRKKIRAVVIYKS